MKFHPVLGRAVIWAMNCSDLAGTLLPFENDFGFCQLAFAFYGLGRGGEDFDVNWNES